MNQNDNTFLSTDSFLKSLWRYERLFSLPQEVLDPDKHLTEKEAEKLVYEKVLVALDTRWWGLLRHEKVGNFIKAFRHLENILTYQYALRGEFYRDHFTHMVRVMLLSHAICNVLGLDDKESDACVLAGLFHDIGLPLSEARNTFNAIWNGLRKCYDYLRNIQVNWPEPDKKRIEGAEFWKEISDSIKEPEGKLSNHALLGAFEFLGFFDLERSTNLEDIRKILLLTARAIANHDYEVGTTITYSQQPVSAILIVADEIQDWGRPVGASDQIVVDAIRPFEITKEKIWATIDYSNCYSREAPRFFGTDIKESVYKEEFFSPLLQIKGKQKNLERVTLNANFPKLHLVFKLPSADYAMLSNTQILAVWEKTNKRISQIDSLEKRFVDYLDDVFVRGGLGYRYWEPTAYMRMQNFASLLSTLYKNIAEPNAPRFNLFQNIKTREFIITTEQEMPAEIVAHKNIQGKLRWNYRVSLLCQKRITFEISLRPSVDDRETYYLTEEGNKTITILKNRIRNKVHTSKEYAERFSAFLQLLFLVQIDAEFLYTGHMTRIEKRGYPIDDDLQAFFDENDRTFVETLWYIINKFDFHFFLLERTQTSVQK